MVFSPFVFVFSHKNNLLFTFGTTLIDHLCHAAQKDLMCSAQHTTAKSTIYQTKQKQLAPNWDRKCCCFTDNLFNAISFPPATFYTVGGKNCNEWLVKKVHAKQQQNSTEKNTNTIIHLSENVEEKYKAGTNANKSNRD